MTPKIVDKEKKKLLIRDSAMAVFAAKGYNKAKMTDIAKTAGIGKGTIYEYYTSKEEIFSDIFTFFFTELDRSIHDAIADINDPIKKLKKVSELSNALWQESHTDFTALMMDFWAEGMRKDGKESMYNIHLNVVYDSYRKLLTGIIDEGIEKGVFKPIDSSSLASILLAAWDGILLQHFIEPEKINLETTTKLILYSFIYGIIEKEYQL